MTGCFEHIGSGGEVYRQCLLRADCRTRVAWVPCDLARVGGVVHVRESGELWQVQAVYGEADRVELDRQRRADKRWESVLKA